MFDKILEDHSGGSSSIRVMALTAVLTVCLGWAIAVGARAWTSYKSAGTDKATPMELPTIPLEVSAFALGCAGLKTWQRIKGEEASDSQVLPPPPEKIP